MEDDFSDALDDLLNDALFNDVMLEDDAPADDAPADDAPLQAVEAEVDLLDDALLHGVSDIGEEEALMNESLNRKLEEERQDADANEAYTQVLPCPAKNKKTAKGRGARGRCPPPAAGGGRGAGPGVRVKQTDKAAAQKTEADKLSRKLRWLKHEMYTQLLPALAHHLPPSKDPKLAGPAASSDAELSRALCRIENLSLYDPVIKLAKPTLTRLHTITQVADLVDSRCRDDEKSKPLDISFLLARLYHRDVREHVYARIRRTFVQHGVTPASNGFIDICSCGDPECIGTCGALPVTQVGEESSPANTKFMHCIILHLDDAPRYNNKSVKIFCNGCLHITGCMSLDEGLRIAEFVGRTLDVVMTAPRIPLPGGGDPYASPPVPRRFVIRQPLRVQMINACFRVSHGLRLPVLHTCFEKTLGILAVYLPDEYPAMRAYWRAPATRAGSGKGVATMFFYTGSILITGFTRGDELLETFEFMMRTLVTHLPKIQVPVRVMSAQAIAKLKARNGGQLNHRDLVSNMWE